MSRRSLLEVTCDLCAELDQFNVTGDGEGIRYGGWTQDEQHDGRILDLCPTCTRDVAPPAPDTRPHQETT